MTWPASTRGPPAESRSVAAPNSTQKAVSSASAVAAGTRPGSPSCRSGSSAGGLKGQHSRKPDAAPAPSQRHKGRQRYLTATHEQLPGQVSATRTRGYVALKSRCPAASSDRGRSPLAVAGRRGCEGSKASSVIVPGLWRIHVKTIGIVGG